jgi:flagellar biosynthesis component FlhA
LKVEPIEVLIGASLLPLVNGEQSLLTERIAALRKQVDPGTVFITHLSEVLKQQSACC